MEVGADRNECDSVLSIQIDIWQKSASRKMNMLVEDWGNYREEYKLRLSF